MENNPEGEEGRVKDLTQILKLMKNSKAPTVYLLEFICERNTPNSCTDPCIQLSCVCNPSGHSVSSRAMLLLEEVARALGSAEQQVLKIQMVHMDEVGVLSALSSRAQRGPVIRKIVLYLVTCDSLNFAKQFLSLLQRIGEETGHCSLMPHHTQLESAVSLHHRVFNCVTTSKEVILSAQKEDLQNIRLCGNEKMDYHRAWKVHSPWHQGMLLQLNIGGAEREANNKEWEVLEEFLAKTQGAREEGME